MGDKLRQHSAVILAAGAGNRMSRLTTKPKSLLPINGRSLLIHQLDHATELGFSKKIEVVGFQHNIIRQHLAAEGGLEEVVFVTNHDYLTKGNGHALYLGEAIGILMFSEQGRQKLLTCAERFFDDPGNLPLNWEHLSNRYVVDNPMTAWYDQSNKWVEIDTPEDYDEAKHKFENMLDSSIRNLVS